MEDFRERIQDIRRHADRIVQLTSLIDDYKADPSLFTLPYLPEQTQHILRLIEIDMGCMHSTRVTVQQELQEALKGNGADDAP
jgi:hypothetical protein